MKKIKKSIAYFLLIVMTMGQTSCFGSFQLTKNVLSFNDRVFKTELGKTILFWLMIFVPIYELSVIIDIFFLNVIEAWTGSNPLSMQEGEVEYEIIERNGIAYEFKVTKNRYHITQLNGENEGKVVEVYYNEDNMTWNYQEGDLNEAFAQIVKKEDQTFFRLFTTEGNVLIEASDEGIEFAKRQAKYNNQSFSACK